MCGLDTEQLEKESTAIKWNHGGRVWQTWRAWQGLPAGRVSYWDMDHVVPVVEGGGGCGLENLRTLCVWCHRAETARLAARRAEQRKRDRGLPVQACLDVGGCES